MEYHKVLEQKYATASTYENEVKTPPVASTLRDYLQNEQYRIQLMIDRKREQLNKLTKLETDRLKCRQSLHEKLQLDQAKHAANRNNVIEERRKTVKYNLEQFHQRRNSCLSHLLQKTQNNEKQFRKTYSEAKNYWESKAEKIIKINELQARASTLYQVSFSRKKSLEERNMNYGDSIKNRHMLKHGEIKKKIGHLVTHKKLGNSSEQKIHEILSKSRQISEKRENEFINKICRSMQRSQKAAKMLKIKQQQKTKTKQLNNQLKMSSIEQERNLKAEQSYRERIKGKNSFTSLSQSIIYNNEQSISRPKRKQFNIKHIQSMKSMKNSTMLNKMYLRDEQQAKQERQIMTEKEISEAIKIRNSIKNDSNMLIRTARFNA